MKVSSAIAGGLTIAVVAAMPVAAATASGSAAELGARERSSTTLPVRDLTASVPRPTSGRLVVKLDDGTSARARALPALDSLADGSARPLGGGWFTVEVKDDARLAQRRVAAVPGVRRVQVDHIRRAFGDKYYRRYQPYLRASMDVNDAWRRATGRGITVAVIDTGVDPNHEDLPRVLRGRDFVSNDRNAADLNGHGTFVAGVIGAERDNNKGIAGASRASILPVRVLNSNGFGRDSAIAKGVRWAASQDADIINLSLGGGRSSRILRDAVRYANNQGTLVVAASGNNGGTRAMYPAAYPEVVAVGATDRADRMTWWSQHGPWVDVVAPGVRIASTVPRDGYARGDGTSFAAPLVAGAAALALSDHRGWTSDELRTALIAGAADAGPVGPDPYTGLGVVDVDGLVGGAAKSAVGSTGPTPGTTPATAALLTGDVRVSPSTPEGTDRWYRVNVSGATQVLVSGRLRAARAGVLRGDIELSLYDSTFRRLAVSSRRDGAGLEEVTAVVADDVYLRVRNLEDTRWPYPVQLDLKRSDAKPRNVQIGGASRPALIASTPRPESYDAVADDPIALQLGAAVSSGSVSPRSVRLLDGETGQPIDRQVVMSGRDLTVEPLAGFAAGRTYTVVVNGLRSSGGRSLPEFRVGFRTAR